MKIRKIMRPVIEVEYSSLTGRIIAYYVWLKFVILKSRVTLNFSLNDRIISQRKCLIIPKYKFIKQ